MKRMILLVMVTVLMSVGFVHAQEEDASPPPAEEQEQVAGPNGRHGHPGFSDIILAATGMTEEELHAALEEEDATLASVLEAAGADVDAVIADLVAEKLAENPDLDEEELITDLTERFNNPRPERSESGGRPEGGERGGRGGENGRPRGPQPNPQTPQDDV